MKLHHIGYAIKDIEKSIPAFELLGFEKINEVIYDKERNVKIQLLKNESRLVELIAPLSEESPVSLIIEKNGNTPYHLCYNTDAIFETIQNLRKNEYVLIEPPEPALAFNGKLAAFLFHKEVGIIELLETK